MGLEEEVLQIAKKLEKKKEVEQTMDLLLVLRCLPLSVDVLKKTRIGFIVSRLRKSQKSADVAVLADVLVKSWRRMVFDETRGQRKEGGGQGSKAPGSKVIRNKYIDVRSEYRGRMTKAEAASKAIRSKSRNLLSIALQPNAESAPKVAAVSRKLLAYRIEAVIFDQFRNTGVQYKNRIRSRLYNLNDPKNPELKENVLSGVIEPGHFAGMSWDDMATKEMRRLRIQLVQEADNQWHKTSGRSTHFLLDYTQDFDPESQFESECGSSPLAVGSEVSEVTEESEMSFRINDEKCIS